MINNEINQLTGKIIKCAIEVHKHLGPGLLESAYERCLCIELEEQKLQYIRQSPVPIIYKSNKLDCAYKADIIVENKVLLELKTVQRIEPIHMAQLLTYLKLTGIKLGLILNFNECILKDGIKRMILD